MSDPTTELRDAWRALCEEMKRATPPWLRRHFWAITLAYSLAALVIVIWSIATGDVHHP